MAKKNLSFVARLQQSNSDVIKSRSSRLASATFKAQRRLIDKLEEEVDQLKDKMRVSLDINPKNSYSLMVGEDFNPDRWTEQYQAWKVELRIKKAELEEAKDTMDELFPEGKFDTDEND